MNSLKKKIWLQVLLGTLFLVVFLAPVSINTKDTERLVSLNTTEAFIDSANGLNILPIDSSAITPTGVTIKVEVAGQPDANEQLWYQILELGFGGPKDEKPLAIDYSVTSKTYTYTIPFTIKPDESYLVSVYTKLVPDKPDYKVVLSNGVTFAGNGSSVNNNAAYGLSAIPQKPEFDIGCGYHPKTWFTKCPVLFLFEFIFKPLASLTTLAAKFLDFFVYYSISSDAYRSGFVEKAWSVVRDISNMLFIIALLYIAIKTILQMNTSDNKRAIGFIIMIALLINFSLFATRVVIDASNILAHVFYNNITPYDENGTAIPPDSKKPKSVSVGLVKTFDPQKVVSDPENHTGEFALVTIIFILLLLYMILMFISISMLFLGRVAGLWMSMMFSPIAFASVAMPFPIPKLSFGKWKNDLFKLAFMAPVYAFFMYVIILFGGFLGQIQYDSATTSSSMTGWLDALMKNVIPFMLIFALLKEAKTLTKDYAGDMGKTFSDIGASVGGLALGAATGGMAMAGRASLGRAGSWLARNTSKDTFAGRAANRLGRRMGTGSWDARNVKVFGKGLSDTGLKKLNTISTPKTGGYEKIREDLKQKRLKRAEEVSKVGYGEESSVKLRRAEVGLQTIMERFSGDIEKLNDRIKGAREEYSDAQAVLNGLTRGTPAYAAQQSVVKNKADAVIELNNHKKALKTGADFTPTALTETDLSTREYSTEARKVNHAGVMSSIADFEKEVAANKKAVQSTERKRKLAYADRLMSWRTLWSVGAKEVAHKIRSGAKFEDKGA